MSYTPINWQTGQTITAEKLNKMDNGWSVETSSSQMFSETVTTEKDPSYPDDPAWGDLAYSEQVNADTLTVTFNGTDYECTLMSDGVSSSYYGGWIQEGGDFVVDFTDYPFAYASEPGYNAIATENEGTYTISAGGTSSTIETSDDFKSAVADAYGVNLSPMELVPNVTTWAETMDAMNAGKILFFRQIFGDTFAWYFVTVIYNNTVTYTPTVAEMAASFNNDGVFTINRN